MPFVCVHGAQESIFELTCMEVIIKCFIRGIQKQLLPICTFVYMYICVHIHMQYYEDHINCVGIQTFEHSELKFKNVSMLKFHIHLAMSY